VVRCAVDVAKHDFVAQLEDGAGDRLALLKWRHPVETRAFLETLLGAVAADRLEVILEPTGTYGDVLRWQFEQAGVAIYRVETKHVHDAREYYDGVPSLHDAKAAGIIAETHRTGRSQRWRWQGDARRDQMVRAHKLQDCQQRQLRAFNRLEALLSRHWPELETVANLHAPTVQTLIEAYGEPAAVARDPDGARSLLNRASRRQLPLETREAILTSAAETLGVPCRPLERERLQELGAELLSMHRAIRAQERAIADDIQAQPALALQAPVIGAASAAGLYAVLGDPQNYDSARRYLAGAGLNLKVTQSGYSKGQLRLTKRGPGLARHLLHMAVLRWIQRDPRARAWYEAKVARDGGRKRKALGALMRKLAKGLWAASRSGQPFDSRRLFAEPNPA
jgi:transposase